MIADVKPNVDLTRTKPIGEEYILDLESSESRPDLPTN